MKEPNYLIAQAMRCRRLARAASESNVVQSLRDMADEFERRARRLARGNGSVALPREPEGRIARLISGHGATA